jgi:hypothetical protein
MGLGRRVAPLACGFPRLSTPFIDDGLGHAHGTEAHGDVLAGAQLQGGLQQRPRCRLEYLG